MRKRSAETLLAHASTYDQQQLAAFPVLLNILFLYTKLANDRVFPDAGAMQVTLKAVRRGIRIHRAYLLASQYLARTTTGQEFLQ